MEEASSAASNSSDASLEGWLRSGCDPPAGGDHFLSNVKAEVVFTSVLDCVFGRGDFGHLKVETVPPGCTRENEDEWELQFDEDNICVEKDECYEVPFDTRIMHPMGSRGYKAAMQQHAGDLFVEKVSEVRANKQELQRDFEHTEIRKRAWSFARDWLESKSQTISDDDRREAVTTFRASRGIFSSAGAKNAAQKVSALRARGLPPPVFEETLVILIMDDLLKDCRRGAPSHPRELRLPLWDEWWGDAHDECWWENGARESIESSAPLHVGARGELAGVVALANVVVEQCKSNAWFFLPDDGLSQLVDRLHKDSPVALCVALPVVRDALTTAAAGTCEESSLQDIADSILPALRNLRDAPTAGELRGMVTSMSAWLAGAPTEAGKRPRAEETEDPQAPEGAAAAAAGISVNFECRCSACALLASFVLSGRLESEVLVPEKARRLCMYASAEAQGRSDNAQGVKQDDVECTLCHKHSVVRIRSHLAKRLTATKAVEMGKQRAVAKVQATALRHDARQTAARGLLADSHSAIAMNPGPLLQECIALASQLVGDLEHENATSKEAAAASSD